MSSSAGSLPCRLLCASGCAYAAIAGEPVLDPDAAVPYYAGAGFLEPPAAFLAGDDEINACLVGRTVEGVLVAFRGTLPLDGPFTLPKMLDWVNDLNAEPVAEDGLAGGVHEGFLDSLNSLWDDVRAAVKEQMTKAGDGARLLITGHSKGGGIAPLAAIRFVKEENIEANLVKVVTFAAPKSGDSPFAAFYNGAIADHTRYEFADDLVPHLPPSAPLLTVLSTLSFFSRRLAGLATYDYERVGTLLYVDRSFKIIPDPDESLLPARRRNIVKLILSGHLQEIADDHRMSCGYGYMSALCPTGVCPQPIQASALQ
jgi:Lipase (class 3)